MPQSFVNSQVEFDSGKISSGLHIRISATAAPLHVESAALVLIDIEARLIGRNFQNVNSGPPQAASRMTHGHINSLLPTASGNGGGRSVEHQVARQQFQPQHSTKGRRKSEAWGCGRRCPTSTFIPYPHMY